MYFKAFGPQIDISGKLKTYCISWYNFLLI